MNSGNKNNKYVTGIGNSKGASVVSLTSRPCSFINFRPCFQKTFICLTTLMLSCIYVLHAQNENVLIFKGNQAYQKGDYTTAFNNYSKAAENDPQNAYAAFNLGNTLIRTNKPNEAIRTYDEAIKNTSLTSVKAEANYNKGLAYIKQKKLPQAIEAFKQALRLTPNDDEARDNLQKALNELKKQQQQPQNNKQQQNQQKQQKKPQSKLSQQMMEQKFRELRDQEKQLQKQLQQKNNSPSQPEKDW